MGPRWFGIIDADPPENDPITLVAHLRGPTMSRKGHSRALRQLAEEIVQALAEAGQIHQDQQADFTTSLVRQWITYDGHATFTLDEHQLFLPLAYTPLGKPYCVPEPPQFAWNNRMVEDWKINPEDLPDILDQLNRGQSVEVTNSEGIPLRVWVNPKERRRRVEPLVKEEGPAETKPDYRKAAIVGLEDRFGPVLDEEEMNQLSCSIARQWQKYGDVASLFVRGDQVLFFLEKKADGGCGIRSRRIPTEIESLLHSLGFAAEAIPEVIARMNLDQEIPFEDRQGRPSILWHDPKARRVCVRALDPVPSQSPSGAPVFCPKCSAVLKPWREGQRQQTCPLCGAVAVG